VKDDQRIPFARNLIVVIGNWVTPSSQSYDVVTLVLFTFLVFTIFDYIAGVVAFSHERTEDWRLLLLILPQRIVYRQLNNFVVVRALLAAIKGRAVGWGTLKRSAKVLSLPTERVSDRQLRGLAARVPG
jgi:hypothetical protein